MLRIPPEIRNKLKTQLMDEEGYRQFVYADTQGVLTVGIGRNLVTTGLTVGEAMYLLDNDIVRCENDLWRLCPFYRDLDNARKLALIDMTFNVGIQSFLGFKAMIAAIQAKDYHRAAEEMRSSLWAKEVGKRAEHLAMIMETGNL